VVSADAVPLHLRRARVTAINMEANGSICRGMLRHRYHAAGQIESASCESDEGEEKR
jgi:hypothetical protein